MLGLSGAAGCRASVQVGNPPDTPTEDAVVDNVQMARGYGEDTAIDPTEVFSPDAQAIWAVVAVRNPTGKDVLIRAEWVAVEAGGEKDAVIVGHTETVTARSEGTVGFEFTLPREFPIGSYAVRIYLNGALEQTAEFVVGES